MEVVEEVLESTIPSKTGEGGFVTGGVGGADGEKNK
jgi:hypothetical protein